MSAIIEYQNHTASRKWNRFFGVPSDSNPNREPYTVSVYQYHENGAVKFVNWACGCPRWTRNANRPECKHIRRVMHELNFGYIAQSDYLPESVTRFIQKFENSFEAVEIAEPKTSRRRKVSSREPSPSDLIELF